MIFENFRIFPNQIEVLTEKSRTKKQFQTCNQSYSIIMEQQIKVKLKTNSKSNVER